MKIEFLADGAADCPLIRMYDYRTDEIKMLCQVCRDLAEGRTREFALHDQPWVEPLAGCRFSWRANEKNVGVKRPSHGSEFVLLYNDEAWREVEAKLQEFTGEYSGGYNWLTHQGDVNVLISRDGGW